MMCGYEWLGDERKERKSESHMERPHENTPRTTKMSGAMDISR